MRVEEVSSSDTDCAKTIAEAVSDLERIEIRNTLAVSFRPYVYKVAREVIKAVRTSLEVEDLVGWGNIGLLEAAARFDASRGVRFRSYAHARIRGAMIDAIRLHHGRRSLDNQARGVDEVRRVRRLSADASYASFDEDLQGMDEAAELEAPIPPTAAPDYVLLADETRRLVERALATLSPLERTVIVQHYVHGEAVCVIARRHKLSKSWLSRVHSRAIGKLQRIVHRLERGAPHPIRRADRR